MTVGPTLHYSHANVRRYWVLAILIYLVACSVWARILTGSFLSVEPILRFFQFWGQFLTGVLMQDQILVLIQSQDWGLGKFIVEPLSIYQYPWQIVVLGLLMGIIATVPVLASQMLSWRHSIPFLLITAVCARLPLLAAFLLISCLAVACRPLRFRSRFISIALCMAPQLVYWAIFGGYESVDPVRWGFSYAPWICAWINSLLLAGIIIAIGHFTRYRPGLIWSFSLLMLAAAVGLFQWQISFAELDYQLHIAGNNPEEVPEFHDHDMKPIIDEAMRDKTTQAFLSGFFYPAQPELLREELKKDIQIRLAEDRWPNWLNVPEELKYQMKRLWLVEQYDVFIQRRPGSKRVPVALYYKAIVNEYSPDVRLFIEKEILRFYSDYPHRDNLAIWYNLYRQFPLSPESIEARHRIAVHKAGLAQFNEAREFCEVAEKMIQNLQEQGEESPPESALLTAFSAPPDTVITPLKLRNLSWKLQEFKKLISEENRTRSPQSEKRLARFVLLNPHSLNYAAEIDTLLELKIADDPLRDNLLFARAMLESNEIRRAETLLAISHEYPQADGGKHALYELGVLNTQLWRDANESDAKAAYLAKAREIFSDFIQKYPESIWAGQAHERLEILPELQ